MNKKSQLMLGMIGFISFIAIAGYGYTYLTNKYMEQKLKAESNQTQELTEEKDENVENNEESKKEPTKVLAPDFTVYDQEGNKVKLSDYKGTPVVLNFWASWCPPCRSEMPSFNTASKTYKKEELAILMVNLTDGQRETKETAEQYIKENKFESMQLLLDSDGDAATAYQIASIPTTILIDQQGYVVEGYSGAIEEDVLIAGINKLLE